jgi:hypothetical protein
MVRIQNEDNAHRSVMQRLKEQRFEQFKLILIMHIVDSLWNINWNLKTKHRNVDTDEMKMHHKKIEVITFIINLRKFEDAIKGREKIVQKLI